MVNKRLSGACLGVSFPPYFRLIPKITKRLDGRTANRAYSNQFQIKTRNGSGKVMIYATASTWAQDLKHRLSNVPFNIGPLASLIGLASYVCFTIAGVMLWLDETRSAFAALASLVIFVIGLIMFGCSILLRASMVLRQTPAAKRSLEMTHHAAE
jgi:hypothetical protein